VGLVEIGRVRATEAATERSKAHERVRVAAREKWGSPSEKRPARVARRCDARERDCYRGNTETSSVPTLPAASNAFTLILTLSVDGTVQAQA
jgi:hypothetical protein